VPLVAVAPQLSYQVVIGYVGENKRDAVRAGCGGGAERGGRLKLYVLMM
jgi:hypothetical protein